MKKTITSLFSLSIAGIALGTFLTANVAHSNGSGAPGSGACTQCHGGTVQATTDLEFSIIDTTTLTEVTLYEPGKTYGVGVFMKKSGTSKFGFALSANAGTFAKANSSDNSLQVLNGYLTHTSSGTTATNDSIEWLGLWTAPASPNGNLNFQLYVNATNADNTSSGDAIYGKQLVLNQAPVGLSKLTAAQNIKLYPIPAMDNLNISYELKTTATVQIQIRDVQGKTVFNAADQTQFAGQQTLSVPVSTYKKGIYFVNIQIGTEQAAYKFTIN